MIPGNQLDYRPRWRPDAELDPAVLWDIELLDPNSDPPRVEYIYPAVTIHSDWTDDWQEEQLNLIDRSGETVFKAKFVDINLDKYRLELEIARNKDGAERIIRAQPSVVPKAERSLGATTLRCSTS